MTPQRNGHGGNEQAMDEAARQLRRRALTGLASILVAGTAAMVLVTPFDAQWTRWLREHRHDGFKDFMSDSMFELEGIGGGDLAVLFLIAVGILYALSWFKVSLAFPRRWRPRLGFMIICALVTGIYATHTIKWISGRARPKAVFRGELPYTEWHEFGPQFIADGAFRGSFPSGHTASAFLFMTLAYILVNAGETRLTRLSGWLLGGATILFALSMGVARSMGRAHWVSDAVAVIFLNWALIHVIYFWGTRVPEQDQHYRNHGAPPPYPLLNEIWIGLHLFLACLGVMATIIGVRAVWLQNHPWLIILTPIGAAMTVVFARLAWKSGFFNSRFPLESPPNAAK